MISHSTRHACAVLALVEVVDSALDLDGLTDEDFAAACETLLSYAAAGPQGLRSLTIEGVVRKLQRARLALMLDSPDCSCCHHYDHNGDCRRCENCR